MARGTVSSPVGFSKDPHRGCRSHVAPLNNLLVLTIAGTIGVISPSGNEVRPFLSIRNLTPIFVGARDR
jgi:hypothetical protein